MISPSQLQSLKDAIHFCIGENIQVQWNNEPDDAMMIVPGQLGAGAINVAASYRTGAKFGHDEVRQRFVEADRSNTREHVGNRSLVVTLRIESDQREYSYLTAEKVRTRLFFGTPRQTLLLANMSISNTQVISGLTAYWDNREVSACALDITLNVGISDFDLPIEVIETVNTTNDVPGDFD